MEFVVHSHCYAEPVVYFNAEQGEMAQNVFQYILERGVAFIENVQPDVVVHTLPGETRTETVVVRDESAERELEEARQQVSKTTLSRSRFCDRGWPDDVGMVNSVVVDGNGNGNGGER